MPESPIFNSRRTYSTERLDLLKAGLKSAIPSAGSGHLTAFVAGSYGRLEASPYSDLDLFFISDTAPSPATSNTMKLEMFGNVIKLARDLGFEEFSNDGEYLKVLSLSDILDNLGGPNDDYFNHFTTRLLLLLESRSVFNDERYKIIMRKIIDRYYKDYPEWSAPCKWSTLNVSA